MHVLMIGNYLSQSRGTRFYCEDLASRFEADEMQVSRVSSRENRLLRLLDIVWALFSKRRQYDIATVDVYSGAGFLVAELSVLILSFLGKPSVAILHGGMLPQFAEKHPSRVERLLRRATRVVTPSRYLLDRFRTSRQDIEYLPNGMDIDAYEFRRRTSIAPRLCWIRAINETYNPLMLIDVMGLLVCSIPDALLTVVGPVRDEALYERFMHEIATRGLEPNFDVIGPVSKRQIPSVLSAHDVFLNTTHFESFGVAVMEAAASGLPIVSTAVGEIPYLWCDEKDALMVADGDGPAMSRAVLALLKSPDLVERLSVGGRSKALDFSWAAVMPMWRQLLSDTRSDVGRLI